MARNEPIPVVPAETDSGKPMKDSDPVVRRHPNFAPALVAGSYPAVLVAVIVIALSLMYYFGLFRM
jgi:hypothetical protein